MKLSTAAILSLASAAVVGQTTPRGIKGFAINRDEVKLPPQIKARAECNWFRQPVDHANTKFGTWLQQYCVSTEYWAGPGSPVVLMTPGESTIYQAIASNKGYNYLDNTTMTGAYAQAIGAATVVLEHRYFGSSSPYDGFDSETLQYLTLEQAASDIANFAKNSVLPFDTNKTSNAPKVPWIYFGAGYTATLGSWLEHFHPGVLHAYHLSSASVEMNADNWYYYDTIRKGLEAYRPATAGRPSCGLALDNVTRFVDSILLPEGGEAKRDEKKVAALKRFFGALYEIGDDDFAYAIATPFRYWEEMDGYRDVLRLCTAVVADNDPMDAGVLGMVPPAVVNFASYFVTKFLDSTCTYLGTWGQDDPLWCLNSYDHLNPYIEARTLGNPWRTAYWFLCNEPLASWETGAPRGELSIVSRKLTPAYWQRQCGVHFPKVNGQEYASVKGKKRSVDDLNRRTGGWARGNTTRVIWTNGEFDPWRATTMSSELRPDGPLKSTEAVPVFLIKNANRGDDALTQLGMAKAGYAVNPEVVAAQAKAVEIMKKWVKEFKAPS